MDVVLSLHHPINIQSGSRLRARHPCNNTRVQNKSFARSLAERRTCPTYVIPVFRVATSQKTKTTLVTRIQNRDEFSFIVFSIFTGGTCYLSDVQASWSKMRFILWALDVAVLRDRAMHRRIKLFLELRHVVFYENVRTTRSKLEHWAITPTLCFMCTLLVYYSSACFSCLVLTKYLHRTCNCFHKRFFKYTSVSTTWLSKYHFLIW